MKTILPGKPGTKKLQHRFGERLVAVRYRYDESTGTRYTTIELTIDKADWRYRWVAGVEIAYNELQLRKLVKEAGGRWNREKRIWELGYLKALELGLEERIQRKCLYLSTPTAQKNRHIPTPPPDKSPEHTNPRAT